MTNLKDLYIFEGFQSNFLEKIINASKKENFKMGDTVLKQGDVLKNAYILTKGIVSVIK